MGRELLTKSKRFYTVCMAPDLCRVQAGTAVAVLPFVVKGEFKEALIFSPNVTARDEAVIWMTDSRIPKVKGDGRGNLLGVKSGTKEGEAWAIEGVKLVVNGHRVCCEGCLCELNGGNTFGKAYHRQGGGTGGGASQRPPSASPSGQATELVKASQVGGAGGQALAGAAALASAPGERSKVGGEGGERASYPSSATEEAIASSTAAAGTLVPRQREVSRGIVLLPPGGAGGRGCCVTGRPPRRRCELRPYHDENGKRSCPKGQACHHVLPDRVYRIGGKKKGARIPGAPSYTEGLCICVSGFSLTCNKQHGRIHHIYDPVEKALCPVGDPAGTARIGELEMWAAEAVARVTGCKQADIQKQLRTFNDTRGIGEKDLGRCDPGGKVSKGMDAKGLGKGSWSKQVTTVGKDC